jgi:hypothetical protein
MPEPRLPIHTLRYKTYLKEVFVEALKSIFAAHPDSLLAQTKIGVDFSIEEADYPAVVVRWYERSIDNAGVAHEEWLEVFDTIVRTQTFTDPMGVDNSVAYDVRSGAYPVNGAFQNTSVVLRPTGVALADRVEAFARIAWNGEPVTVEHMIKADDYAGTGFVGRVALNVDSGKMDLEIYFREGLNNDTLRRSAKVNVPVREAGEPLDLWVAMNAVDDHLTLGVWNVNPTTGAPPLQLIGFKMSSDELVATTSQDQVWLRLASQQPGNTTIIDSYTVNNLTTSFAHTFRRFKHLIYTGDLEFAIYATSSYDRDLIADSLIEILQMADLEAWTNQLLTRIYYPDPLVKPTSLFHFVNLNTDRVSGFGETQSPVPWEAEDQLLYNTSYRIGVLGELYSRVPPNPVYGMVEAVDLYPYQGDIGEPKPNPHPEDPTPWV